MENPVYQEIIKKAHRIRGAVINETALLEKHMEEIVANYFCESEEKANEIVLVILGTDKMSFEGKRNALKYVIESAYKHFLISNPKWFKDLEWIMQQRNIFAHYVLDTSDAAEREFKNGKIGFAKFKNNLTIIYYTNEDAFRLTSLIIKYIKEFRKILNFES